MAIEKGNVVKIHYDAKIGDRVIDTCQSQEPLEFKVGEGYVIKGLEEAIVGLNQGEKKTITIPPEKAYGERQEGLTKKLARNKEVEPQTGIQKGNIVRYQTPEGAIRFATVTQVEEDNVTLDLNHPLAGETITFNIEIVEVKEE